jgi:hypothetical protein
MSNDAEYLPNYIPDKLYIHPTTQGAFARSVDESEETPIGEIEVTGRCKIAVTAFFVHDRSDFNSFKITKMRWTKRDGWHEDGHIQVNNFQAARIAEFAGVIARLDLSDARKAKLSLDNIHVGDLATLLNSTKGPALVKELAGMPSLRQDIYAVAAKRAALGEFERMLGAGRNERQWQTYFEANSWIFGHGLNYVFLDKVGPKLETRTTGNAFDQHGKTADALMRTRAEISQYVLIEIKKDSTHLLQKDTYRAGCWAASGELSAAVTQTQKTAFEFGRDRFRDVLKDANGNDTGGLAYKIACFELYRRNTRSPEIVTFDELYQRTRCIVENISVEAEGARDDAFGPDDGWEPPF